MISGKPKLYENGKEGFPYLKLLFLGESSFVIVTLQSFGLIQNVKIASSEKLNCKNSANKFFIRQFNMYLNFLISGEDLVKEADVPLVDLHTLGVDHLDGILL